MLTNIEAMRLNFMLKNDNKVLEIPIIKIRPNKAQPRKTFDETELAALSASISENGILQPLSVRKISAAEYELVAGERRLRASVLAGLRKVPCIVLKCSEKSQPFMLSLKISSEATSVYSRKLADFKADQALRSYPRGSSEPTGQKPINNCKQAKTSSPYIRGAGMDCKCRIERKTRKGSF